MGLGLGILVFLSSGLFLGWSLGANNAASVFGTAVGSRMVRLRTAVVICSICVVAGAVFGGSGPTGTLARLGSVTALGGAFTVALAAALASLIMTRAGLPISTGQAVVGGILGWNLYTASLTDAHVLAMILSTWVLSPALAGVAAAILYVLLRALLRHFKPHMLRQDAFVRASLLIVGALGSFGLGANNIANVVGVFVPDNPFRAISIGGLFTLGANQQLFLVGGLAIAAGVATYSGRVMRTVGGGLMRISPEAAIVVVLATALVLYVYASESLQTFLAQHGLPTFPLVPVSASQAVVGAIIGLGLLKGGRGIRWRALVEIGLGWVITPIAAAVLAFFLLFFVENVFNQPVARPTTYRIDTAVVTQLRVDGVPTASLAPFLGVDYDNALAMQARLQKQAHLSAEQARTVVRRARMTPLIVDLSRVDMTVDIEWLDLDQMRAMRPLSGQSFDHAWQFEKAVADLSPLWRRRPDTALNRSWNANVEMRFQRLERIFSVDLGRAPPP